MKTLYDSPNFLIYMRPFDMISNSKKTNLLGIYKFKIGNKNTGTRRETCLKSKLKNIDTRMTLSVVFHFLIVYKKNYLT